MMMMMMITSMMTMMVMMMMMELVKEWGTCKGDDPHSMRLPSKFSYH